MTVARARVWGSTFVTASLVTSVAQAQDLPDFGQLVGFIRWGGLVVALLLLGAAFATMRVVSNVAARLSTRFTARRMLIQQIESITRFVLYVVTGLACVAVSLRLDPTSITVIGGAAAFAVGFAMRDLLAAFVAGITIMLDRPFQVGDRVEYAGQYGDIVSIGLRSVRMLTLDHNVVTIPNNRVLTDVTSCGNYGDLEMQVPMVFYVGVDQDVRRACEIAREACLTSPFVFLGRPVPVLAKQVVVNDYVAFEIKVRPYVNDTTREKPFETDVHVRVGAMFAKEGILPPAVLHRARDTGSCTIEPCRGSARRPSAASSLRRR